MNTFWGRTGGRLHDSVDAPGTPELCPENGEDGKRRYVSFTTIERRGRLGGSVGGASDFSSGHDLTVRGFEPRVGLCADSSEPGACFGLCVSPLSLNLPCSRSVSLCLSIINKHKKNPVLLKLD